MDMLFDYAALKDIDNKTLSTKECIRILDQRLKLIDLNRDLNVESLLGDIIDITALDNFIVQYKHKIMYYNK